MMTNGRDGLGGRRKTQAGRAVRGALALILLSAALATGACTLPYDPSETAFDRQLDQLLNRQLQLLDREMAMMENPEDIPVHADTTDNPFEALEKALEKAFEEALYADPGEGDLLDFTPLHEAAMLNANPSTIAALIEGGADPGARMAVLDLTPLHMAAMLNANPSTIAALIEGGADPGARAVFGMTPLHLAVSYLNANPSTVAALIEGGATPRARAVFGITPLHAAAIADNANPSVIKALIEAGADPGARMEGGDTPLHGAAWADNANPSVIEALLEGGADPGARNDGGFTPFDYAKENEALRGTDAYWLLNEGRFE